MPETVRVLDQRRWKLHLYWMDFAALGLFAILGVSLFYDMYSMGYTAYAAAAGTGVYERDALMARMVGEAVLAAISFAWIGYRVVTGGYRQLESRA